MSSDGDGKGAEQPPLSKPRRLPREATEAAGGAGAGDFAEDTTKKSVKSVAGVPFVPDSTVYRAVSASAAVPDVAATQSAAMAAKAQQATVAQSAAAPIAADIDPPSLPAFPIPLDASTSKVSGKPAIRVAEVIFQQLTEVGVAVEVDRDTCCFTCVHYADGMDAHFCVFMYTVAPGAAEYAIEFQRRSGESFLYNRVKCHVWDGLDKAFVGARSRFSRPEDSDPKLARRAVARGPVLPAGAFDPKRIKTPAPLDMDALFAGPRTPKEPSSPMVAAADPPATGSTAEGDGVADTVQLVVGMLESSDPEVVAQGARAAALASLEGRMHEAFAASNVVDKLATLLEPSAAQARHDLDTRSFVATTVANLAQHARCNAVLGRSDTLLKALVEYTSENYAVENTHLRRECARSLFALMPTQKERIASFGAVDSLRAVVGRPTEDSLVRDFVGRAFPITT